MMEFVEPRSDPTEPPDDDGTSLAGEALGCFVWVLLFGFLVAGTLVALYRGDK